MNKLNVFYQCYSPWRYPSNWYRNIKNFFRCFKYSYQRITKGYCDKDLWDLDYTYLNYMCDTLTDFSKLQNSWPDRIFPTMEEWTKYLEETADMFYRADETNEYFKNEYELDWNLIDHVSKDGYVQFNWDKEQQKKYTEREKEIFDLRRANMEDGFDRVKNVFFDLWD